MATGQPATGEPATGSGSDPLGPLRRRWWLVALVTGFGLAAAGGWLQVREPVWESTTSVLVHPVEQDTNVVGGRTQGQVNLDTEAQLVRSTAVTAGAAQRLGLDPVPEDLPERVSVEVPPNTTVLTITVAAATPAGAQAGARAFAGAYLHHRERVARAHLAAQRTAIQDKLDELDGTLAELNQRLTGTLTGTAAAANLESRRDTVSSQVDTLTDRLNELSTSTATVTAGTVISEAELPDHPSRPRPAIVLASGAALGLVAGVGTAGLADRLARRVRRAADLSRRLDVPVLAGFTRAVRPGPDEVASPYSLAGRAFDRLRNEVLAAERAGTAGDSPGGRVIVVTSPTPGCAAGLVAVNLAASLSRSGHDATLLETGTPGTTGPVTELLGIDAAPGLSEVLARRVSVAEALQQPPRHPRLRAVAMGGTATATGLLQSPDLRTALASLAAQTGYVVVAAPATSASADAQSLASYADLALLAVETRRTRLAEVADAAGQLRRVGTPLLGAVVLPPQQCRAAAPAEHDAAAPATAGTADSRPTSRPRPSAPANGSDDATLVMVRVPDWAGTEPPGGPDRAPDRTPDRNRDPDPERETEPDPDGAPGRDPDGAPR